MVIGLVVGIFLLWSNSKVVLSLSPNNNTFALSDRRNLQNSFVECKRNIEDDIRFKNYFKGIHNIYGDQLLTPSNSGLIRLVQQQKCGWIAPTKKQNDLPLLVLSVGLEGAGHHLWTEILDKPVFDCVWVNARHYKRTVGDGVPRTTVKDLKSGFLEMLQFRKDKKQPPCKSIFDAEDSFPTGAIRKNGRVFNRPDIINFQQLDGVLFNIKYLLIMRNVTDTAISALRRNFVSNVDAELRAVEHTLSYIETAMQKLPYHSIFIGHYEHVLEDPGAYIEPLSEFLELESAQKKELTKRLNKSGKKVSRKPHKLTQYPDCQAVGAGSDLLACYNAIQRLADDFFVKRGFMWPSWAGNGFDHAG
eukprot:GSChrysophyteH1.ASY1.ANO1.605.1 assembled CDS